MYEKRKTKERRKRGKQQGIMPALTSELMAVLGIIALMVWVSPREKTSELADPQLALPTQLTPQNQHSETWQNSEARQHSETRQHSEARQNSETWQNSDAGQYAKPAQFTEPLRYAEPLRYIMPMPSAEQSQFAMPTHYVEARHW